jgi:hypothetical protein
MSWINEQKRVWRVAILVLLLVAIMGPWSFELVNVPSEYPCSAPFIRLEGDFCGTPTLGIQYLVGTIVGVINRGVGLVTGATGFASRGDELFREFLFMMVVPFLLVLPFFSTLLLLVRGDRRHSVLYPVPVGLLDPGAQGPRAGQVRPSTGRRLAFNIVAWSLAAGAGLLLGVLNVLRPGWWMVWGIWLYIGLAVSALILEVLTLVAGTRPGQG